MLPRWWYAIRNVFWGLRPWGKNVELGCSQFIFFVTIPIKMVIWKLLHFQTHPYHIFWKQKNRKIGDQVLRLARLACIETIKGVFHILEIPAALRRQSSNLGFPPYMAVLMETLMITNEQFCCGYFSRRSWAIDHSVQAVSPVTGCVRTEWNGIDTLHAHHWWCFTLLWFM